MNSYRSDAIDKLMDDVEYIGYLRTWREEMHENNSRKVDFALQALERMEEAEETALRQAPREIDCMDAAKEARGA